MKAVHFVLLGKQCALVSASLLGLFRRKNPGNECLTFSEIDCITICMIV